MDVDSFLKEIEQKGLLSSKDNKTGSSTPRKGSLTETNVQSNGDKSKTTPETNVKISDNATIQTAQTQSEVQSTSNARPVRKLMGKTEGVEDLLNRSFQVQFKHIL